ncbi:MAG: allophanate hydrolase, partial [Pseudomonadota bacterium]|nr:allophanate hydrolase [Pseudomonadota bacterium]
MTGLRVIAGGLQTTVQDFGRPHVQHLGIPASGAMDRTALRLANRLVGNDEAAAALEIRVLGPTLEVTADSARVALTGSRTPLEIVGEGTVSDHRSVCLTRGQRLRVPALGDGALAYLAVEGGFDLPPVYDSLATFGRAGLGGLAGRALSEVDDLPLALASVESRVEQALAKPDYLD